MVHAYTTKGRKRYRYYVCLRAQKEGWATCPTKSLPAGEVEKFVVDRIRAIGQDPAVVAATLEEARAQHGEAVKGVEGDREAAEKALRDLNAEVRELVSHGGSETTAAGGASAAGGATARLADLQDRLREAERRLTEVRERGVALDREAVDAEDLARALALFDPTWDELFPREQARIIHLLIERVGYDGASGEMAVTFRPTGIRALAGEVEAAQDAEGR